MPIQKCQKNGKQGYKYGQNGSCYTYEANNTGSRARAKSLAEKQGRAIEASKHKK